MPVLFSHSQFKMCREAEDSRAICLSDSDLPHNMSGYGRMVILTIYAGVISPAPHSWYSLERLTGDDVRYRETDNRNARKSANRWVNAEIPYVIDRALPAYRVEVIREAINAYHQHTCIRFVAKTSAYPDYVRFIDGGDSSCYSYIGRQGGAQEIGIGDGCHYQLGIVLHEIAHALGFLHEHTRPDRDDFVKVRFDRIDKFRTENFEKVSSDRVELHGLAYDYLSIMHYGKGYFSISGGDTIVTLDSQYQDKIGQRQNFSLCDLEKINRHYGCAAYLSSNSPCQASQPLKPSTISTAPRPDDTAPFDDTQWSPQ